jgi:uncharacterized protein (DUF1501 family)
MQAIDITRREFIAGAACGGFAILMPPQLLAATQNDARLIVIILRGALDGLAAMPPYGDGHYARLRGDLAISAPQLKLDGLFALHPSLTHLHARYLAKELTVLHAIASPYRERSHFDGQDLLENGTTRPHVADGWLNRALQAISGARDEASLAVAIAQNVPLILRGEAPVNSWAPSRLPAADADTLQRLADLYSTEPYFATRLEAALATDSIAGDTMRAKRDPLGGFAALATSAGRLLAAADGPRIAVLDAGGWDTHANQGGERGQLANRLRSLDVAVESLRTALGAAWDRTAGVIVTEFGRTAAVNGTRGTDHGTASCAFLVGGAVAGGRVIADWPGLAPGSLYESRDLQPTLDLRSLFKGVLAEHMQVGEAVLEERVFPSSGPAQPLQDLIRPRKKEPR